MTLGFGCRILVHLCKSDMTEKSNSTQGAAAAATATSEGSLESVLSQASTPDKFCMSLAKLFSVRAREVALLRAENGLLKFLFPEQLKIAGFIPISSSSSVAAHTALTKRTELSNTFTKVKHARVFETVKLAAPEDNDQSEQASIQKLISAPILTSERKVLGVIQISRKAFDLASAGPDFTSEDAHQLEVAAKIAATMPFMTEAPAK